MSRNKQTEKVVEVKKEAKPKASTKDTDIDPKVRAMMAVNRKDKISEKDKQAKIYSAMANIVVERK